MNCGGNQIIFQNPGADPGGFLKVTDIYRKVFIWLQNKVFFLFESHAHDVECSWVLTGSERYERSRVRGRYINSGISKDEIFFFFAIIIIFAVHGVKEMFHKTLYDFLILRVGFTAYFVLHQESLLIGIELKDLLYLHLNEITRRQSLNLGL